MTLSTSRAGQRKRSIVRGRPEENLSRLTAFYAQAPEIAAKRRLALLQRHMGEYQFLAQDLGTLWQAVEQSYRAQDWQQLTAFREALQPFLDARGFWTHSLTLNRWACQAAQALGDEVRYARYLHDLADMLNQQGSSAQAERFYLQSEEISLHQGLPEWALKSRHMRSMVVRAQGRADEAWHLCQSTVDEARQLSLDQWLAHPLFVLALFARDRGDTPQAEALIAECLLRLDGSGEDEMLAQCHNILAEIALRQKRLAQARAHLDVSLALLQRREVKRLEITTQRLLGELAAAEGRSEDAERIYGESLRLFATEQFGDTVGQARLLFSRVRCLC